MHKAYTHIHWHTHARPHSCMRNGYSYTHTPHTRTRTNSHSLTRMHLCSSELRFGMFSGEEMKRVGRPVQVVNHTMHKADGTPEVFGVLDRRMVCSQSCVRGVGRGGAGGGGGVKTSHVLSHACLAQCALCSQVCLLSIPPCDSSSVKHTPGRCCCC